ncbi:MAG TPA: CHC2 zinc finger domain-containing protein [Candidatus Angelobacter sp.]|nr:CHC2 zinc finger domain-containing protein [Candidatus Angelobacter sp.]
MSTKSLFVDFKAIKAAISMEQVLEHYGLLQKFKKKGDSLSGPCPIHKGENPTQFRVSINKNIWNCFSECKHGGNVLDFIAKMENGSIHAAALKAIEWFQLDPEAMSGNSEPQEAETEPAQTEPKPKKAEPRAEETTGPNKPLKFRLEKLERSHPYLAERGLSVETLVDFGAGFCGKGMMAGRIAIPIHNMNGEVVAYAGRLTDGEPSDVNPKYKLPPGFKKSLELFNIDRASKESPEKPLVIVEGFFDCMKLHQLGHRKTVALMGSSMSPAQEELIRENTDASSRVIVMLDEDEAGEAGREDIAARLSRFCFVKAHIFPKSDMQPEHLLPEELHEIVGGVE